MLYKIAGELSWLSSIPYHSIDYIQATRQVTLDEAIGQLYHRLRSNSTQNSLNLC